MLTGVRRLICMQLVMASAAHLLSLVDARASHSDAAKSADALEREREALAKTEEYYREAANGQAQIVYFAGMATVAVALAAVAASGSRSTGRPRSRRSPRARSAVSSA